MAQRLVRNINTKKAYLIPSIGSIQTSSMMLLRKKCFYSMFTKKKFEFYSAVRTDLKAEVSHLTPLR